MEIGNLTDPTAVVDPADRARFLCKYTLHESAVINRVVFLHLACASASADSVGGGRRGRFGSIATGLVLASDCSMSASPRNRFQSQSTDK